MCYLSCSGRGLKLETRLFRRQVWRKFRGEIRNASVHFSAGASQFLKVCT